MELNINRKTCGNDGIDWKYITNKFELCGNMFEIILLEKGI